MKNKADLKSGYTTGSHATAALKRALLNIFNIDNNDTINITLPNQNIISLNTKIVIKNNNYVQIKAIKSDNDDIDVTKYCEINCFLSFNKSITLQHKHFIEHKPYIFQKNTVTLEIYAGKGLGVVTKNGLDCPIGYPAINTRPREMLKSVFEEIIEKYNIKNTHLYCIFTVQDGENIAQKTANPKLGIIGGISFLGKTGIVKPISANAYIESIKSEINVANFSNNNAIVLTIGNSALQVAQNQINLEEECFVEIGNLVFDTIKILANYDFKKIFIVSPIGKLTKIAQGYQNTNNRYGCIDFSILQLWLNESFPDEISNFVLNANTVSEIESFIIKNNNKYTDKFYKILMLKAKNNLQKWFNEVNITKTCVNIILSDQFKLKAEESFYIK